MGHRALTLKYRPQVFGDMIGQDHVSAVLTRAILGGRVAQAYLFTGARGVGKTTCARILAKALNCEQRARTPQSAQRTSSNFCARRPKPTSAVYRLPCASIARLWIHLNSPAMWPVRPKLPTTWPSSRRRM